MKTTKRRKELSLSDQRKLARLASRPDAPIAMELRVWLLTKLHEQREWFWDQIKNQIENGSRDTEAQGRMLMGLIDRILPTQREVIQGAENSGPTAAVAIKIVGVARGTVQARQQALEIQAEKRAAPISQVA
jgi:hypothetical protein